MIYLLKPLKSCNEVLPPPNALLSLQRFEPRPFNTQSSALPSERLIQTDKALIFGGWVVSQSH